MNATELSPSPVKPSWPGGREAILRIALITAVIFPLSWAINALLVGSWDLFGNRDAESFRHLVEWTIAWILGVAFVFWLTLLPGFHWVFNRRNARRLIITLVSLVTLATLFYAEENWRGARAWTKYLRQQEAKGAQLDLRAFIPKPIPDEENFAATPLIKSWFVRTNGNPPDWNDAFKSASVKVADGAGGDKERRKFVNLAAYEAAFAGAEQVSVDDAKLDPDSRAKAAPAVLAALKDDDAVFAELRGVSQRPRSAYPVHFDLDNPWGIMLPHLLKVKWVCQRLQLKACAELALGKTEDALADVKLMLRMADSVSEEPFLVSFLVRIACVQLATQPVWEGLAEHRWTESQLRELQTHFQRYDFLTDMQRPWNCERAAGTLTADIVRKKGLDVLLVLIGPGQPSSADRKFANWCGGFIPRGWFYFEQVNCCRLYEQQLEGAFDSASKRVWPSRIQANTKALEKEIAAGGFGKTSKAFLRHHVLASLLLPALHKLPMKAAEGQTAADQAALACALERYRLTNGQLPDRLDALAPRFISKLPTDAITGEPYKYHRTEAGQFVLYSVGWDEKNDGGKSGKTLFDDKEGDWVWQYPAK